MVTVAESKIEHELVMEVRNRGGMCPKFVSPGMDGMPDRLVLLRDGKAAFVEVKAPGKKPRKLQLRRHVQLRNRGYKVYVLNDPDKIPVILDEIEGGRGWEDSSH
ncbi:MAG: VRR-NUC domain-containing protein [Lachnospiraceae bacterium]|nr:VRR-NUC domain-containing protein [Lachnospiraceae bacterium]